MFKLFLKNASNFRNFFVQKDAFLCPGEFKACKVHACTIKGIDRTRKYCFESWRDPSWPHAKPSQLTATSNKMLISMFVVGKHTGAPFKGQSVLFLSLCPPFKHLSVLTLHFSTCIVTLVFNCSHYGQNTFNCTRTRELNPPLLV